MLQSIRDRTHGWIAGVIISMLILAFALWGISSYFVGNAGNETVATVNGIDITTQQLSTTYDRLRRQVQMQLGISTLPADTETELKQKSLQSLIDLQVMQQAANSQDYRISTNQVDRFLMSMPELQVNGQFSPDRLQQLLSNMMYSSSDFMDLIRTSLLTEQPRLGIIFSSFALPNEVKDAAAIVNQKRVIQYAVLPFNAASNTINVSAAEDLTYYNQHQDEFKIPEQVSIEYITLSSKDMAIKLTPSDNDLKTYYEQNKNSFDQSYDQVKDKVKDAYVHQKAEEEFADEREKLANVSYEHPESLTEASKELDLPLQTTALFSLAKGGTDLTANQKIRDAAFSSDVLVNQNNSDVIQISPDTVVVLRVKFHQPSSVKPFASVEKQITDKLTAIQQSLKTEQIADTIQQALQKGTTTAQIAQLYHLTWNTTDAIGRNSNKIDAAIVYAAFKLPRPVTNQKASYTTAKVAQGYAILTVNSVQDGTLTPDQNKVFSDQNQNSEGLVEYDLYKNSLMGSAKISISGAAGA